MLLGSRTAQRRAYVRNAPWLLPGRISMGRGCSYPFARERKEARASSRFRALARTGGLYLYWAIVNLLESFRKPAGLSRALQSGAARAAS